MSSAAGLVGPYLEAGTLARSLALTVGCCTNLQAKLAGHIATWPSCFQTAASIWRVLRRPDGRRYHVESIRRAGRTLHRNGIIGKKRIFCFGELPVKDKKGKPKQSIWGTSDRWLKWKRFKVPNPVTPDVAKHAWLVYRQQRDVPEEDQPPRARFGLPSGVFAPAAPAMPAGMAQSLLEAQSTPRTLEDRSARAPAGRMSREEIDRQLAEVARIEEADRERGPP